MINRLLPSILFVFMASMVSTAFAAIESRDVLKTYFETGDTPTETQFDNLIDSTLNLVVDFGPSIEQHTLAFTDANGALVAASDPFRESGTDVKALEEFRHEAKVMGLVGGNHPNVIHFLGVKFEMDNNGITNTHYGFLEFSVDGPLSGTPYAIHIERFVYESTPNTTLYTVAAVPVPAPAWLFNSALLILLTRKRQND